MPIMVLVSFRGKLFVIRFGDDLILNAGLKKSITDCKVDVDLSNGAIVISEDFLPVILVH